MSAGWPYKWTAMIPLVRDVIEFSNCCGSIHHVSGSISTKIGSAPTYLTAFAVAIYVNEGTSTSSPGRTSSVSNARCNATVPLATDMHDAVWDSSANSDSNRSIYAPIDEIHEDLIASTTYFSSSPVRSGRAIGI